MFSLKEQKAKLNHINGREEKNVEEIAFDLKVTCEMHNSVLNMFHDHLLDAFYKIDQEQAQQTFDDIGTNHKSALKFLKMAPIAWGHEMVGCAVIIGYGVGGPSDITMEDCKVNNFRFVMREGGTVAVTFRVITHPAEEDIGKLYSLLKQEITISINPPAAGLTIHNVFDTFDDVDESEEPEQDEEELLDN